MKIVRSKNRKGISLMVLVITIVVMVILVSVVVISTRSSINNARLTAFANDINELEDAAESYYLSNGILPYPEDAKTPLTKTQLLDLSGSASNTELTNELGLKKDDVTDQFYYIDLSKLNVKRISSGNKTDGTNDVYVLSYPTMNVYYVKGIIVDNVRYFTITSKISNVEQIDIYKAPNEDNSTTSVTVYDGISVAKQNGWTNIAPLTIKTNMNSGELLYISLAGTEKQIDTQVGAYNKSFNLVDLFTTNTVLSGGATFADNQTAFNALAQKDKIIMVVKKDGSGNVIGRNTVELSNYEVEVPTITDIVSNSYTNMNVVAFKVADTTSKVKEVRYDYLTKIGENGTEINYYTGVTDFDISYLRQKGKSARVSDSGNISIDIPKNVRQIRVAVIDSAGNWIIPNAMVVQNLMYVGEVTDSATTQSVKLTSNVYSTLGISQIKFSISSDASTYTNEQVFTPNTSNTLASQQVEYTGLTNTKVYIKIDATDNNATVADRKTLTRIVAVNIGSTTTSGGTTTVPGYPNLPVQIESGINPPVLTIGMTPVKWDTNGSIVATTLDDTEWYNYNNQKWANARTADGSLWVWIPRYEYKITTPHSSSSTTQVIAVNFIEGTGTTPTTDYIVHPAFTFGTTELTGIWVAKFEASGTTAGLDILPGIASLRNVTIDSMFTACRNMESNSRYGWGTSGDGIDTHLIKNIEWGAVAYLSDSRYGLNGTEVAVNANTSYITGGGTGTAYSTTNIAQSTTGNAYGIYDMSGGSSEFVAAYVATLTSGTSLLNADAKYKDVYTGATNTYSKTVYSSASTKKGDAIYETSSSTSQDTTDTTVNNLYSTTSWFGDYSDIPGLLRYYGDGSGGYYYTIFVGGAFVRGGSYGSTTRAGLFAFGRTYGSANAAFGGRPVLAVSAGI